MTNRDFVLRPIRKKRLKDAPTDGRVQETDSIDNATPPQREKSHVEWLVLVVGVSTPQGEQIMNRHMHELSEVRGVRANQVLPKLVECRFDGRMSRKHIADSGCPECH